MNRALRKRIAALIATVVVVLCVFARMLHVVPRSSRVDVRLVPVQLTTAGAASVSVVPDAGLRAPSSSSHAIHITSPQSYAVWAVAQLRSIFRGLVSLVSESLNTNGIPVMTEVPKPLCTLPGTHVYHAHMLSLSLSLSLSLTVLSLVCL